MLRSTIQYTGVSRWSVGLAVGMFMKYCVSNTVNSHLNQAYYTWSFMPFRYACHYLCEVRLKSSRVMAFFEILIYPYDAYIPCDKARIGVYSAQSMNALG